MNKELDQRIKNADLTSTEKRVAEYISNNYASICSMSAMKLSSKIGTSDTSVIRTARKLGFRGYAEMQAFMLEVLNQEASVKGGVEFFPPTVRLDRKQEGINADDLYEKVVNQINENVNGIFEKNTIQTFQSISEIIHTSERVFVAGFRGCAGTALHLGGCLSDLFPNVRIITQADSRAIETILDIQEGDCLFIIGYPRYAEMLTVVMEIAQKAGAKIIGMTDKWTSPIAKAADEVLISDIESVTINNSYVASSVIVELLLATIQRYIGPEERKRMEEMDHYITQTGLY